MAFQAKLINRARLQRRLDAIPKAIKDDIKVEMARQADALVERIKGVVPVDTGELRNSIGWTWGRVAKGKTILAQATSQLGGELTITVFAGDASTITKGKKKTFWQIARIVEFGSQGRAAQPYFFPVWRAYKKDIKAAIRAAGKEAIKKAAGK